MISILIRGCANDRVVLTSQMNSMQKISDTKLGSMTYPEIRVSGNYFFANGVNGVKGEIWLSNYMIYESKKEILEREFSEPFIIKVQLYEKEDTKNQVH